MARLFVAALAPIGSFVEITDDDDGYHGTCSCGEQLFHHREDDLIEYARIHVDQRH